MKDVWQLIVFGGIGAVLFLPLVVSEGMFFPFITGKNFGFRIIVEVTLAAWLLLALYEPLYRPRFSWLLPAAGSLLVVMFFANLFGEYAPKSFWSNYERMDGYVTLVHFVGYFLVLGSVLSHRTISFFGRSTTPWYVFFVVAMVAAVSACFTAFQELAGTIENSRGWRLSGTLGNASYMAIYMLFNVFIATWLAFQSRQLWVRIGFAALIALFVFLLVQTATRGTILALAGGTFMGALYIAIFNTQFPRIRKFALAAVVGVVVLVGGLFAFQDSSFVENNTVLNRATNVSLKALDLRIDIWTISLDGIAEKPLLGWGQGNYNYIFNEYYDPSFAGRSEEWYDRGHNIFIDWLSAGGILGLIAYLSIWAALVYYLLIAPHRRGNSETFTVTERGLLVGIFVGYFIHNLVVFDNIVSYIFFAILLALVHSRVSATAPAWPQRPVDPAVVTNVVTPVVLIVAALVVYVVNVPGMQAAGDIIDAYRAQNPTGTLAEFDEAFARNGFAEQELVEQLTQQALRVASNQSVDAATRQEFIGAATSRLEALIAEKPNDARLYVFASSLYRSVGNIEQARAASDAAIAASPNKPTIKIERAILEYQAGDVETMLTYAEEAYELNPQNPAAQSMYASALIFNGAEEETWRAALITEAGEEDFRRDQLALIAANETSNYPLLEELFAARVERNPDNAQNWVSLSFAQYRQGDVTEAISTLEETAAQLPNLEAVTQCFIGNMEAGRDPQTDC